MLGSPGEGPGPESPGGSSRLPEGRGRSGSGHPPLGSLPPVQECVGGVPRVEQSEAGTQKHDQVAQIPLTSPTEFATLRRSTRVRNKTDIYQAGLD